VIGGIGDTSALAAIVSPTYISGTPAIVIISPAKASLTLTLFNPSLVRISVILPFL
jgi:hypothetical protein